MHSLREGGECDFEYLGLEHWMFKGIGFSHAFQPIIDISKSDIVSYEVLLRGLNNEAPWIVFDNVAKQDWISFDQ